MATYKRQVEKALTDALVAFYQYRLGYKNYSVLPSLASGFIPNQQYYRTKLAWLKYWKKKAKLLLRVGVCNSVILPQGIFYSGIYYPKDLATLAKITQKLKDLDPQIQEFATELTEKVLKEKLSRRLTAADTKLFWKQAEAVLSATTRVRDSWVMLS